MPLADKTYIVGTGANARKVVLNNSYDDISTQLGMVEAKDTDTQADADIADLKKGTLAVEMMTMRRASAAGSKRYYKKIIVPVDKVAGIRGSLIGKTFGADLKGGAGEIKKIYFPQRERMR